MVVVAAMTNQLKVAAKETMVAVLATAAMVETMVTASETLVAVAEVPSFCPRHHHFCQQRMNAVMNNKVSLF